MKNAWILVVIAVGLISYVGMSAYESYSTGKPLWTCVTTQECTLALGHP